MDELMLYEYLNRKGMGGMSEHEFMDKFREFMNKYRRSSMRHGREEDFIPFDDDFYMRRHNRPDEFMDMFDSRNERLSDKFRDHMRSDDMDRAIRY